MVMQEDESPLGKLEFQFFQESISVVLAVKISDVKQEYQLQEWSKKKPCLALSDDKARHAVDSECRPIVCWIKYCRWCSMPNNATGFERIYITAAIPIFAWELTGYVPWFAASWVLTHFSRMCCSCSVAEISSSCIYKKRLGAGAISRDSWPVFLEHWFPMCSADINLWIRIVRISAAHSARPMPGGIMTMRLRHWRGMPKDWAGYHCAQGTGADCRAL